MNGDVWGPVPVDRDGPRPIDGTGTFRLATTGPSAMCAYLSNGPHGLGLEAVSTHEAGHCAMHGYGLLDSPPRGHPRRRMGMRLPGEPWAWGHPRCRHGARPQCARHEVKEAATIGMAAVEDEAAALEAETETAYGICGRSACLYTVRDRLKAKRHDESRSSEFPTAAVGIPTPEPMAAVGRHMEAAKVVYPSEYDAIVAKIRGLHEATQSLPVKHCQLPVTLRKGPV